MFFRESQKLWHREAFTQRIFYTQKLFKHTSFSTEAFAQRSFYSQELIHTDAFTHRSLYTRRLLRTEAFTQRSLYTQTLSHRKNDSTEQLLHTSKKTQLYVSFWRSAIISWPGLAKFAFCHMFGCPTCAISAEGCPCPKYIHIPPHVWAFETHDLRRRLLRAKTFRISPHHMFAHPTRAISAEGCPRTNKTRISPHVWVSDTHRHAAEGNIS